MKSKQERQPTLRERAQAVNAEAEAKKRAYKKQLQEEDEKEACEQVRSVLNFLQPYADKGRFSAKYHGKLGQLAQKQLSSSAERLKFYFQGLTGNTQIWEIKW